MPLDSLMMGFMHGVPALEIHDQLWPDEIAAKMWPFLKAVCENMLHNQVDYLFEGEAVSPQLLKELTGRYPGQLTVCFLGFAEVDIAQKMADVQRYPNHAGDWLAFQAEDGIRNHLENMQQYSRRIQAECAHCGFPYFDTSADFANRLEAVVAFLEAHRANPVR